MVVTGLSLPSDLAGYGCSARPGIFSGDYFSAPKANERHCACSAVTLKSKEQQCLSLSAPQERHLCERSADGSAQTASLR